MSGDTINFSNSKTYKSRSFLYCKTCKKDMKSLGDFSLLASLCSKCKTQLCSSCEVSNILQQDSKNSKVLCNICYKDSIKSIALSQIIQSLSFYASEKSRLITENEKSQTKLNKRLNLQEKAIEKIKVFNEKTKQNTENSKKYIEELKQIQETLIGKLALEQNENSKAQEYMNKVQNQHDLCLKNLERHKEDLAGCKKQIIALRNELANLQDANISKTKQLDELEQRLEEIRCIELSKKERKLRTMIEEDLEKLDLLAEENAKIIEILTKTEESSVTSVVTMEEVSTNQEEEESVKEINMRIQEQLAEINKLKFELQKRDEEVANKACACLLL